MSGFTPLSEVARSRGYGDMFAPAFEIEDVCDCRVVLHLAAD